MKQLLESLAMVINAVSPSKFDTASDKYLPHKHIVGDEKNNASTEQSNENV